MLHLPFSNVYLQYLKQIIEKGGLIRGQLALKTVCPRFFISVQ